jgi:lipopolysaccharide/colanic/teichoic acid biosynthesis glycosyltransferase
MTGSRVEDPVRQVGESTNGANGSGLAEHLTGALDERTLTILESRRANGGRRRRGWLVRRLLLGADLAGLTLAFLVTELAFLVDDPSAGASAPGTLLLLGATLPGWVILAKIYGLYAGDEERTDHSTVDDLVGVFHLLTVQAWITYAGGSFTGLWTPHLPKAVLFWALAIALVTLARAGARFVARRRLTYFQNTVIVGTGEIGRMIARKYLGHPEYGINLVGFIDAHPVRSNLNGLPLLGPPESLPEIVQVLDIERVVVAFSRDSHESTLDVITLLKDLDVQVDIVPRLFEVLGPNLDVHTVEGLPLIGLPPLHLSRSSLLLKRTMDVVLAGAALLLLAPLMLLIALLVKLDSPGPALYMGMRIGRDGRRFPLLKFRTMRFEFCVGDHYGADSAEAAFEQLLEDPELRAEFERTHKLREDPRVTRLGRFLRRSSLDELPQLVNVLRGELSIVGPRPITELEYERLAAGAGHNGNGNGNGNGHHLNGDPLGPGAPRRLRGYWEIARLRPGVTGYWQITGRSGVDYTERTRLDMAYVTGWSLKLDLMIFAKTLRVLLSNRGAY